MNLFEKYGGAHFWSEFLNAFYTKLTASSLVRHHFRDRDVSHIKEMLLGLLEVTLVSYTNVSEQAMRDSHKSLSISQEEFDEWVSTYRQTLKDSGVTEIDAGYIIDILNSYKPMIVEDH
jgi:truncated hemoglobin YjbI